MGGHRPSCKTAHIIFSPRPSLDACTLRYATRKIFFTPDPFYVVRVRVWTHVPALGTLYADRGTPAHPVGLGGSLDKKVYALS